MSWQALALVSDRVVGSAPRKAVLICLANHANPESELAFPRVARIMAETELAESTVRATLSWLRKSKLIIRVQGHSRYRPAAYVINTAAFASLPLVEVKTLHNAPDLQVVDPRPPGGGPTTEREPKEREKTLSRPNGRTPLVNELIKVFSAESGLPVPNETYPEGAKRAYVLWRLPLAELADSCQNDEGRSRALLKDAIKRMRNDKLTISSPKSIMAVAASILAEGSSSAETPAARWRRENLG